MKKQFLLLTVLLYAFLNVEAATIHFSEMPPAEKRIMPVGPNEILSFSRPIDKAKDSIVYIATKQTKLQQYTQRMNPLFEQFFGRRYNPENNPHRMSLGSGVIVSEDGYIVTNSHVVEDADSIMVKIPGSDKEYAGKLIGSDPKSDVAVIKIDAEHLKPIRMGNSSELKIGDVVFAIGNPFGVGLSVSQGIISAQHKNGIGINEYENFIQTDASINPGNSGGALVDSRGALIGINSAIITRSGGNNGIGFAIEVDMVKDIAQKLIESGSVARGYLGVSITDLTKELHKLYKHDSGALVNNIEPDSPAAAAGLKRGDLIIGVDGHAVKDAADLKNMIGSYAPGKRIKVAFERDGKDKSAVVELSNLSDNPRLGTRKMLGGLTLENLNDKYRYRLGIPNDVEGVLVTKVAPHSEAAKQGIRPGDIIVQVEQTPVASVAELSKVLKHAKKGLKRVYVYRAGRVFIVALK
jgi:serine protease Do